jgi:flagellar assembly factor FliW
VNDALVVFFLYPNLKQGGEYMKIQTKYFGEMEIDSQNMITFPEGILGLEEYKQYMLFQMPDNPKFYILQSPDEAHICFLLIKPWDFYSDYEMDISDEELETIHIDNIEKVAVFNIVSIMDEVSEWTANLLAPILMNAETREGLQIVLQEEKYKTKHRLFVKKEGDDVC